MTSGEDSKVTSWFAGTKPHEWVTVAVSVGTFLYTFGILTPKVDNAEENASEAVAEANSALEEIAPLAVGQGILEQEVFRQGGEGTTVPAGVQYVVQLASYFATNCEVAQDEADSYEGQFSSP